jgi:hypothetical protein
MEEVFLNIDAPGFDAENARLKSEGFVERKYTSTASKEIEGAFKRHLLKQMIPTRGLTTPAQINALKNEIEGLVDTTLYKVGANGGKFLKFKMYIPSEKLRKQREKALMEFNNEAVNEEFAPENYAKHVSNIEKMEKELHNVHSMFSRLNPNSSRENIDKALSKSIKAEQLAISLLNKVNASAKPRVQSDLASAQAMKAHAQDIYRAWSQPFNELSNLMEKTHLSNQKQSTISPSGLLVINEGFIESLIPLVNTNTNNNNNNRNTDKITTKAMVSGKSSGDIRFIRDTVNLFISQGMDKTIAIKLGVVLANLPPAEFNSIKSTILTHVKNKAALPQIARQLADYLAPRMTGGKSKKLRKTRRHSKKHHKTRRNH